MNPPVPLLVIGAAGRMGREILAAAARDTGVRVAAALLHRPGSAPLSGVPSFHDLEEASRAAPGAVAVDLSGPAGGGARIRKLAGWGHPIVEGTTGLDGEAETALADAARRVAVVRAPNLSLGIALLRRALDAMVPGAVSWRITLEERHHAGKKDAPSGTALLLAADIVRRLPAPAASPPIQSIREGDIVGEHAVHFATEEETILLAHRALSRRLFARGALAAARFAAGAPAGLYGMDDVIRGGA
jgi:4-hydroxy-tetrahydrodipicolinate reductase